MTPTKRLRTLTPNDFDDPGTAWVRSAMHDWGSCGVAAYNGEHLWGRLVVCPSVATPAEHPLAAMARTPGGATVIEWWVDAAAPASIARQLVESVCGQLIGQASSIDAAGADLGDERGTGRDVLPISWLMARGFVPREVRGQITRMVLDLDRTVGDGWGLHRVWRLVGSWARPVGPAIRSARAERLGRGQGVGEFLRDGPEI